MGRKRKARAKAAAAQAEADALAAKNQAIVDAQNEQLALEQANQQTQLTNFQTAQETITAQQNQAQANFAAAQAASARNLAAERAKIEQQNRVNQSVSQSLQVLATKDKKKKKVPMAGKDPSRKGEGNQARYNSPTKDLRVGFSEREGGVGVNLGG
jgi:hypothetical protein